VADYLNDQNNFVADPKDALIAELRRQNEALIADNVANAQTIINLRESGEAQAREFQHQVASQKLRTEGTKNTVLSILRDMKEDGIDTDYLIAIADTLDIETDATVQRKVTIEALVEIEVGLFEEEVSDYDFDFKIFHKTDQVEIVSSDIEVEDY